MQNQQNLHPYIEPIWNGVNLEFMIKFCVIYFFVVWVALIIWVAKDISSRSHSRILQVICVLIMILFTPLWILLYVLIRPRKSIDAKYSAEIEWNLWILSEIVQDHIETTSAEYVCPSCSEAIEPDFIVCPSCKTSIKDTCHGCHKLIRETWSVCPYCETKQKKKKNKEKKYENKKEENKKKTD
jgi:RNA polymerase subunit RPABC4/transcription elongation factor Spt4